MKRRLLLLALFSITVASAQFKVHYGTVIWQKVYEKELNLKSGPVRFRTNHLNRLTTSTYVKNLMGADMRVDHKHGRTLITMSNIVCNDNQSTYIGAGITSEAENYLIDDIIVKRKNSKIRPWFFNRRDSKQVNEVIERTISALLETSKDDW